MATRGKWFETKEHRTAKKFATEKKINLWKVTQAACKTRAGEKLPKTTRYYAGAELPKVLAKAKGVTVDPVVKAS
jgi:hypothetical protein